MKNNYMKKAYVLVSTFLLVIGFSSTINAEAISKNDANPSVYLNGVADKLLSEIKANQKELKTDTNLAENLVRSNLLPAIDTHRFAKATLGKKAWTAATDSQKTRFVNAFIQIVINSYAKGLALYEGQTFSFSEPRLSKSGNSAKVRSSMAQPGSTPIVIDYRLSNKSGNWKIINLTIEGVSMVKSYKSQFAPRLAELGLEKFIVELETKS